MCGRTCLFSSIPSLSVFLTQGKSSESHALLLDRDQIWLWARIGSHWRNLNLIMWQAWILHISIGWMQQKAISARFRWLALGLNQPYLDAKAKKTHQPWSLCGVLGWISPCFFHAIFVSSWKSRFSAKLSVVQLLWFSAPSQRKWRG